MEGEIILKVEGVEKEIEQLSALEGNSEYAKGKKDVLVSILWNNGFM